MMIYVVHKSMFYNKKELSAKKRKLDFKRTTDMQ